MNTGSENNFKKTLQTLVREEPERLVFFSGVKELSEAPPFVPAEAETGPNTVADSARLGQQTPLPGVAARRRRYLYGMAAAAACLVICLGLSVSNLGQTLPWPAAADGEAAADMAPTAAADDTGEQAASAAEEYNAASVDAAAAGEADAPEAIAPEAIAPEDTAAENYNETPVDAAAAGEADAPEAIAPEAPAAENYNETPVDAAATGEADAPEAIALPEDTASALPLPVEDAPFAAQQDPSLPFILMAAAAACLALFIILFIKRRHSR